MANQSDQPQNQADADGFVYMDPDELDGVIVDWEIERDGINGTGNLLSDAYYSVQSPVGDVITHDYFAALGEACAGFYDYNHGMSRYTEDYLGKLMDCQKHLVTTEDGNTVTINQARDF